MNYWKGNWDHLDILNVHTDVFKLYSFKWGYFFQILLDNFS